MHCASEHCNFKSHAVQTAVLRVLIYVCSPEGAEELMSSLEAGVGIRLWSPEIAVCTKIQNTAAVVETLRSHRWRLQVRTLHFWIPGHAEVLSCTQALVNEGFLNLTNNSSTATTATSTPTPTENDRSINYRTKPSHS